ncbi:MULTISPECIES: single-stranded-DNA-specific exonuclease RecJ [unclassified Halanaerobium]|uniref:single-stranded-DNA-specific exonuclease RecJ n=1 Tax=unclassified Halanaerobium TaxID=2641197 RepID=UPI000DF49FFE|nr:MULTISPECIES: single-stranded-DNA-specific exonuclease RecJ [unclassified Halanaerobium]RCW49226.1 RecJ-like putative exonuclease [Halanaerobium sp. MA284_MarDTE_T2]RCW82944.1 RecJ-like putative exonuclease [Halanaerobium sp. DL-01]
MKSKVSSNRDFKRKQIERYIGNKKIASLLIKRGFSSLSDVKSYINPEYYDAADCEEFPDLMNAAQFIIDRIEKNKKILIYGDYDVDGITSTSILTGGLSDLTENVYYHIPDRFKEGYGLNRDVIEAYSDRVDLIISCDCGITNHKEVEFARKMGLEIVITDHHELPEKLPNADYVLSPRLLPENHRAYWLPGAGMAFFLLKALYKKLGLSGKEKEYYDLLLLAIIADVVPLVGENRYLYQIGLKYLKNTDRIGLKTLYKELNISAGDINEQVLGFQLGPVLNSPGRMDDAAKGLKLLLTDSKIEAAELTAELIDINRRRKTITSEIVKDLENNMSTEQRALIRYNPDWHQGVIGIAAGRISENYNIPTVLMTKNKTGELITASARSVEGVNINEIIKQCSDLLVKYGGHAAAAGFSLKPSQLEKLKIRLNQLLNCSMINLSSSYKPKADIELKFNEIDEDFYSKLRMMAPFGEANPEPIFSVNGIKIISSRIIAENHKKFVLSDGLNHFTALWWWADEVKIKEKIRVLYTLNENIYNGSRSLQLEIKSLIETETEKIKKEKSADIKLEVRDFRNKNIKDAEAGKEGTAYFLEGRTEENIYPLINRFYYKKAKCIAFLSIPPSADILAEAVVMTGAEYIEIYSAAENIKNIEEFIKKLTAMIKYVFVNENRIFSIEKAALFLSEQENTVRRGIDYLSGRGFIDYEYLDYNNLVVSKNGIERPSKTRIAWKYLNKLLEESRAFRRYILSADTEDIKNLIISKLNEERK